jgi:RNA polymerase sigma factor (sigma-70 family)
VRDGGPQAFEQELRNVSALVSEPLFDAARMGDLAAIDRLLELTQPSLRRYAQRNCLITDVDDAVQEVMLVLSRYVGKIRSAASLARFLFQVMRRECRRMARKSLGIDLWDEARTDAIVARLPPPELRLEIVAAIQSLPEHYREVLVLRDFEELTISELASRLELTRAAVKSRLHRARELVREYLCDQCPLD